MTLPNIANGLRLCFVLAAVYFSGFAASTGHAQVRTWTDISGTYSIEAELVQVTDTDDGLRAELLMTNGKRMAVLVSKLCESDATLAREFVAASIEKAAAPDVAKPEINTPKSVSQPEGPREDSIVSRPLSAPIAMAESKLNNRNVTNLKFDPATAIRLEREIKRDHRGRPMENPVYLVEVTDRQLLLLPRDIRALVDQLRDPKVAIDVKRRAIDSLKNSWPAGRHPGLLNVMINTLSHKDKYLRLAAIDLLANHDSDQSLIYIFARVDDISFDVRWRTYEILTQLRDPRIIPELCERLNGADRTKVAGVLQAFGSTSAPLVQQWIDPNHDDDVLLVACQLLGNIGDRETLDALLPLEKHESLLVRSQAKNSVKLIKRRLDRRASKATNLR